MSSAATPPVGPRDCEAIGELLAWYANDTLSGVDRAGVDAHMEGCEACRTTLALERRIVESIRAPRDKVEPSHHAGWQKLAAALDASGTVAAQASRSIAADVPGTAPAPVAALVPARPARRRFNWFATLGAAVAVQAAVIAVMAIALMRYQNVEEAPRFHTLASADPTLSAPGPLVRVAFDASVDEPSAHALAERFRGRILAGPSPENVYTFVFASGAAPAANLDDKVNTLRHQAHVLLVEPVVLGGSAKQ